MKTKHKIISAAGVAVALAVAYYFFVYKKRAGKGEKNIAASLIPLQNLHETPTHPKKAGAAQPGVVGYNKC